MSRYEVSVGKKSVGVEFAHSPNEAIKFKRMDLFSRDIPVNDGGDWVAVEVHRSEPYSRLRSRSSSYPVDGLN